MGIPRSTFYYAQKPRKPSPRKAHPRKLSDEEETEIRKELNSERFQDKTPRDVYAALLDEGTYLCSWRTMYRVLKKHDEVRERRDQLRHPSYHQLGAQREKAGIISHQSHPGMVMGHY
jgi:putative transposase